MTTAVQLAQSVAPGVSLGFKNRVINGNMTIDQRNAGASVTPASGDYLIDRFVYFSSQASKFTVQQNAGSVTPPVGFSKYLGFTVASSVSIGANDTFQFQQRIEGFNFADLMWGTANAKTITLSFQVYSSLTGTFGGALRNSTDNRSYPFTYTISSANTWTTATITIAGDTSGTWVGATNGIGVKVIFGLGEGSSNCGTAGAWASAAYSGATGQVSVVGTNGATFYITGVQLEVGTTATPFEFRDYGRELIMCQRYYQKYLSNTAGNTGDGSFACWANWSTTNAYTGLMFPQMRSAPSGSISSLANFTYYTAGNVKSITVLDLSNTGVNRMEIYLTASGLGQGDSGFLRVDNGWFALSAEL